MARSAIAEMHSGFGEIRNTYHTNFVAKYTGKTPITDQGKKEIERFLTLWNQARTMTTKRLEQLGEKDEGFLFGSFGIADAFFWPVLWVRLSSPSFFPRLRQSPLCIISPLGSADPHAFDISHSVETVFV